MVVAKRARKPHDCHSEIVRELRQTQHTLLLGFVDIGKWLATIAEAIVANNQTDNTAALHAIAEKMRASNASLQSAIDNASKL